MADPELKSKVQELIAANPVLLFMKGTPDAPRCGFSMRVVQVLDAVDVEYGAIDVLPALQPLREVTTEISDWQTFPQLYVNGELLGGADIVEEMYESGELAEALGVEQPEAVAAQRTEPPGPVAAAADRIPGLDRGCSVLGGVLFDLERRATTTGGDDVRVVDLEARALQAFHVVDLEPKTNCMLTLSTTTATPSTSKTLSSSLGLSKASAYWKPEQPPPRTATRSACRRLRLTTEQLANLLGGLVGKGDRGLRRIGHFTKCSGGGGSSGHGSARIAALNSSAQTAVVCDTTAYLPSELVPSGASR